MRFSQDCNTKQYPLNAESIDLISSDAVDMLTEASVDRKTVQRFRLSIEESLGIFMEKLGGESTVKFEAGKRLLRRYLRISINGAPCNPYYDVSGDFGSARQNMLTTIGLMPEYAYHGNENSLTFYLPRKRHNQIVTLMMIILISTLVGILGRLFLPAYLITSISESVIAPIEETMFRLLSCIAGPMIFLSVAWGVYGIGDVYTLGRIGKKLMLHIFLVVLSAGFFGCLFYGFLGPRISNGSVGKSGFGSFFKMTLDIFPANVFSPFIEGNTLQVIFIAFMIGLSMIFLGQRTAAIAHAVEQINHIITFIMGIVSRLVPFFVSIVLVKLIWSNHFQEIKRVWVFAVIFLIAQFIYLLVFTGFVSIRQRISPFFLIKTGIPSYLIALSTASSSATFECNLHICREKLGVSNAFSAFGIPLSMVLFKPITCIYYLLFCFFSARMYDIPVSPLWILIAIIITAVSAMATPPIPGGAAATYTVLFLQLGIPADVLSIAVAVDMIFDFVTTSTDMYLLLLEVFHVSCNLGMRQKNDPLAKKSRRLR